MPKQMPPLFKLNPLTVLVLGTLLTTSIQTLAQEQSLQSVVITAGRLQAQQFETPAATYSVDQSFTSNTGTQVNLSDALSLAPGVV